MVTTNAQKWLNETYELPDYHQIPRREKEISISHSGNIDGEWLEGELVIENFPKLQSLNLAYNNITSLKIVNCPNLKEINLMENKLSSVDFGDDGWGLRSLNLIISGTDVDGGLEHLKRETWLHCKPLRPDDKVKIIWDKLSPLRSSSSDGINFTEQKYKEILQKEKEQEEEIKKWETIKNDFQNILNEINNLDTTLWEAKDLLEQAVSISKKISEKDNIPTEVKKIYLQIYHQFHSKFNEWRKKGTKSEDITDQQLVVLMEIIDWEENYIKFIRESNQITKEVYREIITLLHEEKSKIGEEKKRRTNPLPNNNENNSTPFFSSEPINLPTINTDASAIGSIFDSKNNSPTSNNDKDKTKPPTDKNNNQKNEDNTKNPSQSTSDSNKLLTFLLIAVIAILIGVIIRLVVIFRRKNIVRRKFKD